LILSGLESDDLETAEAAESFGCGSCAKEALPVLGHLLGKYIHDSEKAFRHNLVLGGIAQAEEWRWPCSLGLASDWKLWAQRG
jgi:hypothetical protein